MGRLTTTGMVKGVIHVKVESQTWDRHQYFKGSFKRTNGCISQILSSPLTNRQNFPFHVSSVIPF